MQRPIIIVTLAFLTAGCRPTLIEFENELPGAEDESYATTTMRKRMLRTEEQPTRLRQTQRRRSDPNPTQ